MVYGAGYCGELQDGQTRDSANSRTRRGHDQRRGARWSRLNVKSQANPDHSHLTPHIFPSPPTRPRTHSTPSPSTSNAMHQSPSGPSALPVDSASSHLPACPHCLATPTANFIRPWKTFAKAIDPPHVLANITAYMHLCNLAVRKQCKVNTWLSVETLTPTGT